MVSTGWYLILGSRDRWGIWSRAIGGACPQTPAEGRLRPQTPSKRS
nr:hypothetical protein [Trichocoleus desertorum]